MGRLESLRVKVFADGANLEGILEMYALPVVKGFTTNPTLMRKAGVTDYERFARTVLERVPDRPISFEVFADEPKEMVRQALKIASWGTNVYVKIPITNTEGIPTTDAVSSLARDGVKLNVTAILVARQVEQVVPALAHGPSSFVSVFAGRVADTGTDPLPILESALDIIRPTPHVELIWASPRELLNIIQADQIGCHVITVTNDILRKLTLVGKDLINYSLETVRMFYDDGRNAGYRL